MKIYSITYAVLKEVSDAFVGFGSTPGRLAFLPNPLTLSTMLVTR
jgi:hypothetical protein